MKKKFLFFFCFLVFVFSNINLCFADEFIVQLPELPVRDDYPYYIIYKNSDSRYYLKLIPSIDYSVSTGYDFNGHKHYYFGPLNSLCFYFNVDSTEWLTDGSSSGGVLIGGVGGSCSDCNVVYSNFDMSYNGSIILNKHELSTGGFDEPVDEPSILDGLKDLFVFLFVPSDNLFHDFKDLIEEKFGIFKQIKDITMDLSTLDSSESAPNFSITYSGHTLNIIDFSMFTQYRSMIHNIIILISGFYFVKWLIVSAPSIVMGQSVGEESAKQ